MCNYRSSLLTFSLGTAVLLVSGCQRDEVVEYTAPKETHPEVSSIQQQLQQAHASFGHPPHQAAAEHVHAHDHDHGYEPVAGRLQFAVPEGWKEQPLTTMRQASFLVKAGGDAIVDISVMSFPGDTGGVHANINRWRGQVGLAPLAGERIDEQLTRRTVNGDEYLIVDIPGVRREGSVAQRIVGAIHGRGGRTWFFKMMGDDELTAAQRDPLIRFLESVRYPE